ncbi:hypothetical protein QOZ88_06005 [Blastococcus sp. BMG 814]|uniref:Phage tail protein n=1 Tax=Blastococcus carthaginiensis TaxID=3050034 RepID=A0ABT9IAI8_9ACTN|nr:hypothetical protein [Blastococcus carthaginiensis]MDP5182184.1 hypothetical protein [Blastococcus carthaginiensis]
MTEPQVMTLAAASATAMGLPKRSPVTTRILFGELRTGRITGVLPVTGAAWSRVQNDAGTVDQVRVHRSVVAEQRLRQNAAAARCFLAVEQGDRIRQAGPIWKHSWSRRDGRLTLGAAGLWSLFDHRKVLPVLAGRRVQDVSTTLTGADYGELARALVAQALGDVGGDLPLVLPAARTGSDRTETWPGWALPDLGEQLRQFTTRDSGAPDIRFTARRRADDARFLEFVMETGTAASPQLSQAGADWTFDTTVRKGPVLDIAVEQDATEMGMRGWITGNGSEADTLIATHEDLALVQAGYPLLELERSHSSVEVQSTLDGHARTLVAARARPVEVWKLTVRADAALEVLEGDYARVKTKGDDYLPDGEHRVRVQKISGGLGDTVVLDMYPLKAVI